MHNSQVTQRARVQQARMNNRVRTWGVLFQTTINTAKSLFHDGRTFHATFPPRWPVWSFDSTQCGGPGGFLWTPIMNRVEVVKSIGSCTGVYSPDRLAQSVGDLLRLRFLLPGGGAGRSRFSIGLDFFLFHTGDIFITFTVWGR